MAMRVMVTGGAGFIGGHLVDAFLERRCRVSVIDNLTTGLRENLRDEATLFEIDIRDRDQVLRAFEAEPPEVVLHLAAQADVRRSMDEPAYDAGVNLIGSLHLLEAARRFGTERFVFASTGGAVYGEPKVLPATEATVPEPLSCYGASKRAVEYYLAIYASIHGLRTTVLRYANVYGPRQNPKGEAGVVAIFSQLLLDRKQPTIFGDGSKTRDYVFVGDVVRANLLAIDREADGVFNIGTGRQTTDREVFEAVRDAAGVDVEAIYAPRRKGEVEHIALDAARAAATFGWKPEVGFAEGVRRAVESYRARRAR
jgi:UDP-glucose 4-epimerase